MHVWCAFGISYSLSEPQKHTTYYGSSCILISSVLLWFGYRLLPDNITLIDTALMIPSSDNTLLPGNLPLIDGAIVFPSSDNTLLPGY